MALIGSMPRSMAIRTSRSMWPCRSTSEAVTSSVQNPMRSVFAPDSVTVLMFSSRKCATDDSRSMTYMPLRSFSRVSGAE